MLDFWVPMIIGAIIGVHSGIVRAREGDVIAPHLWVFIPVFFGCALVGGVVLLDRTVGRLLGFS